jgi:hypothetical protein
MRLARRFRIVLAVALALASLLAFAMPAQGVVYIQCRLAASASQSEIAPGVYDWDIIMFGECGGDFQGRYAAFGSGDGTSQGLGLCDGSLVVQNLDLDVDLFLDSAKGPAFSKFLVEHWFAPLTTFPLATPFLIEDVSGPSPTLVGAGTLHQYLGLNCETGSPSTAIITVRLTI